MTALQNIVNQYDTFLVDMVGVVYDGINAYPGVIEFLNHLIATKEVIILSNNPRPNSIGRSGLTKLGLQGSFDVITSGDFTRDYLLQHHKQDVFYHLGHHVNQDITRDLGLNLTMSIEEANAVLLTCFIDEADHVSQFDSLLQYIIKKDLPVFCANPDVFAFYGDRLRKTAGFFANRLIEFGYSAAKITILGKPNVDFYNYAALKHPSLLNKKSVLMIGDTMETDIAGACAFGIDSLLTLTGITGLDIIPKGISTAQYFENTHQKSRPTFIFNQLSAKIS